MKTRQLPKGGLAFAVMAALTLSACTAAPVARPSATPGTTQTAADVPETQPSPTTPPTPTASPTVAPVLFRDPVFVPIADQGAIAIADFDGDGNVDFASAGVGEIVTLLLGSGDGTFASRTVTGGGGDGPASIAAADLNGDGRLDLVLAHSGVSDFGTGSDDIVVLLARKDGSFKTLIRPAGINAQDLAVGDFNADGIPDLVTADNGPDISIFVGTGDGTFADAVGYPSGAPFSSGISVADFNADGKLDVATANSLVGRGRSVRTVSVLLGNGDGSFGEPFAAFVGGPQPIRPVTADLNGDGMPDVVTPNGDPSHEVSVLLGLGDGHLGESVQYHAGADAHSLIVADLNDDGHPDIAAWDSGVRGGLVDRGLSVLFGMGDGTFGPSIDTAETFDAEIDAVADLDNDGRPDVVLEGDGQLILFFSVIARV